MNYKMVDAITGKEIDTTAGIKRLLKRTCKHEDAVYHQYVGGGSTKCQVCGKWLD